MNIELMQDFDARSDEEQQEYFNELHAVNNAMRAVRADKKGKVTNSPVSRLNPDTNYKLIYR